MTAAATRSRVVLLLAVALVAVGAAWLVTTSRTADQVDSSWTMRCPGWRVTDGSAGPVVVGDAGWRCSVTLTVRNDSAHPIRVRHLDAPFVGSESGVAQGYSTDDATVRDVVEDGSDTSHPGVDATYDVDLAIPPHSDREVVIGIGEPERRCSAAGVGRVLHWPTIEFTTLHRTFHRTGDQSLQVRHDRDVDDDCDLVAR